MMILMSNVHCRLVQLTQKKNYLLLYKVTFWVHVICTLVLATFKAGIHCIEYLHIYLSICYLVWYICVKKWSHLCHVTSQLYSVSVSHCVMRQYLCICVWCGLLPRTGLWCGRVEDAVSRLQQLRGCWAQMGSAAPTHSNPQPGML